MQTLASQSVLAIQNARLFREIAEKSEQLAEASRHKSQFLANMSHELRTPLNAILGYAELSGRRHLRRLPPRAAGVLERVQNNGRHLLALINDVLDLSKIEAGQLTLRRSRITALRRCRAVGRQRDRGDRAQQKGLRSTADVAPGLPTGHGDERRLTQVLLNLVGNAIKFTDAGEVAIRAPRPRTANFVLDRARHRPRHRPPSDQARIFDEFQQVDSSAHAQEGRHRARPCDLDADDRDAGRHDLGRLRHSARERHSGWRCRSAWKKSSKRWPVSRPTPSASEVSALMGQHDETHPRHRGHRGQPPDPARPAGERRLRADRGARRRGGVALRPSASGPT